MKNVESVFIESKEDSRVLVSSKKEVQSFYIRKGAYYFSKRIFDIVCSTIGCITLVPLYGVIKLVSISHKDYSPVIYSQKRIGKNGREFEFYKFRSMIPDAEEELVRLLAENEALAEEYRVNKKLENDPRITKLGSFLRRTSLDEMPQFLNVLKNDMSLIGNRPYLPMEKEDMGEYFEDIVSTKCGIVSYWAVNGRNDVSFEERLKLEAYYSNNQSLALDLKIFVSAFGVVLKKKGAK